MSVNDTDTIAAIATPPGKGGVGIIRLSGPQALSIGQGITGISFKPRYAHYANFKRQDATVIDTGLALYFPAPNSFTGEDVVELHGHGGPLVQDLLLTELIATGARQARAGEFSERAFLNDKIDLTQAEAIADLIDSTTTQAAQGAMRSLQGEFSEKVHALLQDLIYLRTYVEAAIDFPDEEIDFLADEKLRDSIHFLQASLNDTIAQAGQGAILRNGLRLVIAGKPNAGKSSLLNALAGYDVAIVTNVPGTTRDIVTETIDLDGLPVHIIDTAGLRHSEDTVEQIGIERARKAIQGADHVLHIADVSDPISPVTDDLAEIIAEVPTTRVFNKMDLLSITDEVPKSESDTEAVYISVKTGAGLDDLKAAIKAIAGFKDGSETTFTARRRHITALQSASDAVQRGIQQLEMYNAGELLADELLQAQTALNEITGEFSADDLLGEIFSGFCIGK